MNHYPIKSITIKECSRCGTTWAADRQAIDPHDQINIIKVTIAYCPVCADDFASEINRPTYERRGKRKQ